MSNSLWTQALQHTRLPCPSRSPGVCSNSCPLSQWCHPPSHPLFPPSPPALNCSQSQGLVQYAGPLHHVAKVLRASASASVLPMNIQGWLPLGLTGLIFLLSKGLSRVFSSTTTQKHQFFNTKPSLWSNSHIHTWLLENHSFDNADFCWKSDSHLFNMLPRFGITFLPRSKFLLIS